MLNRRNVKLHEKDNDIKIKETKSLRDPSVVYISLSQNIGAPSKQIVKIGDKVKRFQKIAEGEGFSANVHSPISGEVIDFVFSEYLGRTDEYIVIKNDYKSEELELKAIENINDLTKEDIIDIIKENGIVGLGGAQFPTHIKYGTNSKINTFIVNAAECEPYLSSDYRVMIEYQEELKKALYIINKMFEPKNIVIGFEKHNKELKQIFNNFGIDNLKCKLLPTSYPQGSELQLIKSITKISVPKGAIPAEYGVLVSNISTIKAIYDAVYLGKPLVERIVTVESNVSKDSINSGNYLVKIGTTAKFILSELKYNKKGDEKLILGGPMMGAKINDVTVPLKKGTGGLLILKNNKDRGYDDGECIGCSYCVQKCPMKLMPYKFVEIYNKNKPELFEEYNLNSCIECGVCEYVCPSRVPLIESIKKGKMKERKQ